MKYNCLSVLLFNIEALTVTKTDLNNLTFPLYRAFMKIFHVKNKDSVGWCQYYMHQLPVEYLIDARKFKYYVKMSASECFLLQHLYCHAAVGHIDAIKKKYGISCDISYSKFLFLLWQRTYNDLVRL